MKQTLSIAAGVLVAVTAAALAPAAHADVLTDNFDDNTVGDAWSLIVDDASALNVAESSGAARVTSAGGGSQANDAIYLSSGTSGFRLSTADPFSAKIDYRFTSAGGGSASLGDKLGLVFGVGEDLDGQNSAAVGYGYGATGFGALGGATSAYRVNDAQTVESPDFTAADTGTFVVEYDPSTDKLSFRYPLALGGTNGPDFFNLVRDQWHADALYLSFGARGGALTADPATTYFDDLAITQGTLVPIPEPASLALMGIGAGGLLCRRKRA